MVSRLIEKCQQQSIDRNHGRSDETSRDAQSFSSSKMFLNNHSRSNKRIFSRPLPEFESLIKVWHQRCRSYLVNKRNLDRIEFNSLQDDYNERTKIWLNFFLNIASLKLSNEIHGHQSPIRCLNFHKDSLFKRLTYMIVHLFSIMKIIYYVLIIVYHYRRDLAIELWRPVERIEMTELLESNCSVYDDRLYANNSIDLNNKNNILMLNDFLIWLGDIALATTGASLVSYTFAPTLAVFYFYNGFFHFNKHDKVRVDLIAFIVDPTRERQRVYKELTNIFRLLVDSVLVSHGNDLSNLEFSPYGSNDFSIRNYSTFSRPTISRARRTADEYLKGDHRLVRKNDASSFIKLLNDLMQLDKINPSNLSLSFYRRLSKVYYYLLVVGYIYHIYMIVWVLVVDILIELNERVKQRLIEVVQCRNGSSTLEDDGDLSKFNELKRSIRLPIISSVETGQFACYPFNRGIMNYLELFSIEFKHYLTLRTSLGFFILLSATFICGAWFNLYTGLHFMCHYTRMVWINQIVRQLQSCVEAMRKLASKGVNEKDADQINLEVLHKSILATYLNYELFRRQQGSFQSLSSFLVSQGAGLCALIMCVAYIIGSTTRIDSAPIMIFLSAYVTIFINIYLICAARITQKINKFCVGSMELIAYSSSTPFKYTSSFDLVKRQLLGLIEADR